MGKQIVVVGSINLDLVAATERIPIAGETIAGLTFRTFPGGKGANQAVAAARLGGSVSMVGKLGADPFGVQLRDSLEESRVNTGAVEVVAGSSGVALIVTDAAGQNAITVIAGANAQLSPADLDDHIDLIRGAGILLTQLEIPLETVEYLAGIAAEEHVPLMLDPAPAIPLPVSLLKRIDWLTPNETETCILTGLPPGEVSHQSMEAAANTLLESGCRNVILKLGDRGCYVALSDGTRQLLPAYAVRALDTTAAGDAFNGAFAVALMSRKQPFECASWASAVAAISVTRHGAQTSMPTANEVETFLEDVQSAKSDR
ncbi:MAG TPA: ribokinase [Candidatus Sulfotelmatobacter sp.]|nr:ribokinase [Candidatus Sulfotelmatobacter sp.]